MPKPVTIITGVSRGIGAAIASDLAARGHHVIGLARTRPAAFAGTFHAVDLADADATAKLFAAIVAEHPVSALVNNAGVARMAPTESAALADFDLMMATNVRAVLQAMQAVVPGMRARRHGRIVTIGSRAALGKSGRAIYSATKAAVIGLTRTAALEFARDGVTVNCVAPGPIETDMIRQNYPAGSDNRATFTAGIPARRFGKPDEIAAAVRYFLSDDAGFTTGQVLYVCGGASVGLDPV